MPRWGCPEGSGVLVREQVGVRGPAEVQRDGVAALGKAGEAVIECLQLGGELLGQRPRARRGPGGAAVRLEVEDDLHHARREPRLDQAAHPLRALHRVVVVLAVAVVRAFRGEQSLLLLVAQHPLRDAGARRDLADPHRVPDRRLTFTLM